MQTLLSSYRRARDWVNETGQGGGKRIRVNIERCADQEEIDQLEEEFSGSSKVLFRSN